MSLKKFGINDVILNTMKAHPKSEFFIYDSNIYYNNTPALSGAFASEVMNVSGGTGYISLYEYNIDKSSGIGTPITDVDGNKISRGGNSFIYPFVDKSSAGASFSTISDTSYNNEYGYGDTLVGKYPLSSSVIREYMSTAGTRIQYYNSNIGLNVPIVKCVGTGDNKICTTQGEPKYRHYWSLRNRINFLGTRSKHYKVTGSQIGSTYEWIKDQQDINMISIPSIFYGSRIYPGTVSLQWYFTGSLKGELRDTKQNGELIQVTSGSDPNIGADNSGSVAGVVLYEEGIILLTGSWSISGDSIRLTSGSTAPSTPKWLNFGAGALDDVSQETTSVTAPATPTPGASTNFVSASFGMSFKGDTDTQVVTMFANARRGEANYSNNPTFLKYGQEQIAHTSSQIYEENSSRLIKNIVSSSYDNYSASFERQVYISRVGIYDANKNLLGIATLANPVLKKEDEDLTFKLRLDI